MRGVYKGLAALALAMTVSGAALADGADLAKGKKIFARCKACHTLEEGGPDRIGPNLYGIIGRTAGTKEGFKYSDAMKQKGADGLVWDDDTLMTYLEKPSDMVPSTSMAFPGLKKEEDRHNVVAYVESETSPE